MVSTPLKNITHLGWLNSQYMEKKSHVPGKPPTRYNRFSIVQVTIPWFTTLTATILSVFHRAAPHRRRRHDARDARDAGPVTKGGRARLRGRDLSSGSRISPVIYCFIYGLYMDNLWIWLVVEEKALWKRLEFVNWDDEITDIWTNHPVMFQENHQPV